MSETIPASANPDLRKRCRYRLLVFAICTVATWLLLSNRDPKHEGSVPYWLGYYWTVPQTSAGAVRLGVGFSQPPPPGSLNEAMPYVWQTLPDGSIRILNGVGKARFPQGTGRQALAAMGTNALPSILSELHRTDSKPAALTRRLVNLLPPSLQSAFPHMRFPGDDIQLNAAPAVTLIADPDTACVELIKATTHENAKVRAVAVKNLDAIRPHSASQYTAREKALVRALSDPDADVQLNALKAVSNVSADANLAEPLNKIIRNGSPFSQFAVLHLENHARKDSWATVALNNLLADDNLTVRSTVAGSISSHSVPRLPVSTLESLVKSGIGLGARPALRELVRRQHVSEALLPEVKELLQTGDNETRLQAALAIELMGGAATSSIPLLEIALRDYDPRVVEVARRMINKLAPDGVPHLNKQKE